MIHQLILYSKQQVLCSIWHSIWILEVLSHVQFKKQLIEKYKLLKLSHKIISILKGQQPIEKDWIRQRKYKNEKEVLTEHFIQHGKNGNERTKALQDIRSLINRHGREGVYLCDPYLTYEYLIDTLYYCKYLGKYIFLEKYLYL